jgi:2-dehydropantoate 2-reductase
MLHNSWGGRGERSCGPEWSERTFRIATRLRRGERIHGGDGTAADAGRRPKGSGRATRGEGVRVAVVGAGALGCLFGGRLAAADHEVHLLHHRTAAARELDRNGVTIEGPAPITADVTATTDAAAVGPVDLALVLVRAHQTRAALEEHAACLGPDTLLCSLQNGLRTPAYVREAVDPDRALFGITYEAAVHEAVGRVCHTSPGETVLGGATPAARERVRAVLTGAGAPVRLTDHPRRTVWEKGLLVAATAPVLSLTGRAVAALDCPPLAPAVDALLAEGVTVATARGVDVDGDGIRATIADLATSHGDHEVSMAQDVARGRRTEVDELNGAIVAYGAENGVATPANRTVAALIRGLAGGDDGREREG